MNFIKRRIDLWHYNNEHDTSGLHAFLQVLAIWWRDRPRRVPCSCCAAPVWYAGWLSPHHEVYCSEACKYYGPGGLMKDHDDDAPPF